MQSNNSAVNQKEPGEKDNSNTTPSSNGTLASLQNTTPSESKMALPLWAIILICVGGATLLTSGVFILIHLIGKKVRQNNATKEAKRLLQQNKMFF
jgi:hypothetical protein